MTSRGPVPRLCLRPEEAARAVGLSRDTFDRHIRDELKWIRVGTRIRLVSIDELNRWADARGVRLLSDDWDGDA